ncbi:energy transducer TonB [Aequorivita sp. SDUM287046]|uniref:Energy transducer TonB n=1 Tax=Aequorivita aurantiaca TaxID=3053356 RepID=A0ABT8DE47_9FLAO|nr:energy transducer TonB [Aequorivita aurantiaca]MDN3723378.1 energy transducer TonB [Aequorivita aurantiaca]
MKATSHNARNKRDEKKQINIKWNSRLFFQMGVIASLLAVFFIMQTDFEMRVAEFKPPTSDGLEEPPFKNYVIDLDIPKPAVPVKKVSAKLPKPKVVPFNTVVVKPNNTTDAETPIDVTDNPIMEAPAVVKPTTPAEDNTPRNMINVEFVPVFPGCETYGSNAEKVACMSSKINHFINENFRKEVLEDLKANETYKIYVNFKINAQGFVTDVKAHSHSGKLKKEAQRVVNTLPVMKPGRQGSKNVDVVYTVPITFKIK